MSDAPQPSQHEEAFAHVLTTLEAIVAALLGMPAVAPQLSGLTGIIRRAEDAVGRLRATLVPPPVPPAPEPSPEAAGTEPAPTEQAPS